MLNRTAVKSLKNKDGGTGILYLICSDPECEGKTLKASFDGLQSMMAA